MALKLLYLLPAFLTTNVTAVYGGAHLSVKAAAPALFAEDFSIDDEFAGLHSDRVEVADGIHKIEVYGPRGEGSSLEGKVFYLQTITVEVLKAVPKVTSASFYSHCGTDDLNEVSEWPSPIIVKDKEREAYSLVIGSPVIVKSDNPCEPLPAPMMAPYAEMGAVKVVATSVPAGAEVWVRGRNVAKTNTTINVPHRGQYDTIGIVIRRPGLVNCFWALKAPFAPNEQLNCATKAP